MKNLYFLRHGESEFNKSMTWSGSTDTSLTELGKVQAANAGEAAENAGLAIDMIISSPLSRAIETAKIFASKIKYPVQDIVVDDEVIERNFGSLEGKKDLVAGTKYMLSESAIDNYPGVENIAELQARADKFYTYLKTIDKPVILVVGHGAFGRALRRSVNNLPINERGSAIKNAELVKFL